MSISYHKHGLVNSHQSAVGWFIFFKLLCRENILTKLVGYQQPNCLCVKMEFVLGNIALSCECIHFHGAVFVHVGPAQCVRKIVFHFACAVLWKLHV